MTTFWICLVIIAALFSVLAIIRAFVSSDHSDKGQKRALSARERWAKREVEWCFSKYVDSPERPKSLQQRYRRLWIVLERKDEKVLEDIKEKERLHSQLARGATWMELFENMQQVHLHRPSRQEVLKELRREDRQLRENIECRQSLPLRFQQEDLILLRNLIADIEAYDREQEALWQQVEVEEAQAVPDHTDAYTDEEHASIRQETVR